MTTIKCQQLHTGHGTYFIRTFKTSQWKQTKVQLLEMVSVCKKKSCVRQFHSQGYMDITYTAHWVCCKSYYLSSYIILTTTASNSIIKAFKSSHLTQRCFLKLLDCILMIIYRKTLPWSSIEVSLVTRSNCYNNSFTVSGTNIVK